MNALKLGKPKSILRNNKETSGKLSFSDSIEYTACKGYQDPNFNSGVVLPPTHVTTTLPSLKFGSTKPFEFAQPKIVDQSKNMSGDQGASSSHTNSGGANVVHDTETQEEDPHGYIALENLVDDMAFQFWECSRCLSMGHVAKDCTRKIRCHFCFRYGHFRKHCFDWKQSKSVRWVPKQNNTAINEPSVGADIDSHLEEAVLEEHAGSTSINIAKCTPAPGLDSSSPVSLPSSSPLPPPPSQHPPMANFEVDPTPWLPHGH
jgi:hypothetical protein